MRQKNSPTILKAIFIIAFISVFAKTISAQNAKPHYVVNNTSSAQETANYINLFKDFNFDQYRFYDKRRIITFIKSNVTVELYSAKELLEIYQKPISPFTIMDNVAKKEIAFLMNGGKVQIVTIK